MRITKPNFTLKNNTSEWKQDFFGKLLAPNEETAYSGITAHTLITIHAMNGILSNAIGDLDDEMIKIIAEKSVKMANAIQEEIAKQY